MYMSSTYPSPAFGNENHRLTGGLKPHPSRRDLLNTARRCVPSWADGAGEISRRQLGDASPGGLMAQPMGLRDVLVVVVALAAVSWPVWRSWRPGGSRGIGGCQLARVGRSTTYQVGQLLFCQAGDAVSGDAALIRPPSVRLAARNPKFTRPLDLDSIQSMDSRLGEEAEGGR
ncbi:hypothetical protein R1sor_008159 [Riccia sorocarpa]|uniref:Uncharacterized protein n=1 Tax=Riccia sorocarpa TaxID=122646 RepID=A0ABD3HSY8_9MARC